MKEKFLIPVSLILFGLLLLCSSCAEPNSPESVFLVVGDSEFTITDASGNTLSNQNGFSGSLSIIDEEYLDEIDGSMGEYRLEVPYSNQFTYECLEGERQSFSIAKVQDTNFAEYAVSGTGFEKIEADFSGQIHIVGKDMDFTAFLSMPCDALGEKGCVRFYGTSKDEATFKIVGDAIEFSGICPESGAISYAGERSNPYVDLDLKSGSAIVDFSKIDEGNILIYIDGYIAQKIPIN